MTVPLVQREARNLNDIEEEVCTILAEVLEKPAGTIHPDALLDEGLGVDSMALIQAQVGIEEHFGVVMPDIDEAGLAEPRTVKDLVWSIAEQALGRSADG